MESIGRRRGFIVVSLKTLLVPQRRPKALAQGHRQALTHPQLQQGHPQPLQQALVAKLAELCEPYQVKQVPPDCQLMQVPHD